MNPHTDKVDKAIEPGINKLTWTSINIDAYMQSVYDALSKLELLIDRVNDLVEFRIEAVLHEMANMTLCELPEEEPWTVDEFLERTQMLCAKGATILQSKSVNVEDAVYELIDMLCEASESEEEEEEKEKEEEGEQTAREGGEDAEVTEEGEG